MIAAGPAALAIGAGARGLCGAAAVRELSASRPTGSILDDKSRNTEENAQFAKALAGDTGGQTWLLVTSAFHMPRSVGLFRMADSPSCPGRPITSRAAPKACGSSPTSRPKISRLRPSRFREWAGLLGYKLTGKIDELVPGTLMSQP